ncbi:uncharacterized protein T26G10.4-like [Belonocnema kinseyi]|uniref:uncharacterized protein T26G10.4-like n=1 Tax=Belonocnema kinseyi TaxID=2817044 RepID=UPI00143D6CE2|nr:uncharacterized protein T26G10.4-like [Belonocnema kinseyi]
MQSLLHAASEMCNRIGLKFKPSKCSTFSLERGKVLESHFTINGEPIKSLTDEETYDHLGIPTGARFNQNPIDSLERAIQDLAAIHASLLAPWQKLEATSVFVVSRPDFILRGGRVNKTSLTRLDKTVKIYAKIWMSLSQRASGFSP